MPSSVCFSVVIHAYVTLVRVDRVETEKLRKSITGCTAAL